MEYRSGSDSNGETQGLHQGLPDNVLAELRAMTLPEAAPEQPRVADRVSLRDLPYMEALRDAPELVEAIDHTMVELEAQGKAMPVLHVTTRGIRYADGSEQSSGFLEDMAVNGLRARDTNVAAFVKRGSSTAIADPDYSGAHPDKLLRDLATSLKRYIYHGSRTNKEILGEGRGRGVGLPAMLIVDSTHARLLPGSDYDDHYRLGEVVPPTRIMGAVELSGIKPSNPDDVAEVTRQFLGIVDAYLSKQGLQ